MATTEQITETLKLMGIIGADQSVDPQQDLFDSGVLDSLGMITLIGRLESDYQIKIADVDLMPENFGTIEAMAEYVSRRRGAA